jgi:hypothetical protein
MYIASAFVLLLARLPGVSETTQSKLKNFQFANLTSLKSPSTMDITMTEVGLLASEAHIKMHF